MNIQQAIYRFDSVWHAEHRDRPTVTIKLAATPVAEFAEGWFPEKLIDLGLDIHLLELAHENGARATWFLNDEYDHISDNFAALTLTQQNIIARALFEPIKSVYDNILCNVNIQKPIESLIHLVNEQTLEKILDVVLPAISLPPAIVNIQSCDEAEHQCVLSSHVIPLRHIASSLRWNVQHHIDNALQTGYLVCFSPVDGSELRSRESFVIHEHRIAYRFIEPHYGFVFYISMTHHVFQLAELYIPIANIIFTDVIEDTRTRNSRIASEYLLHFVAYSPSALSYCTSPDRSTAIVCRGIPSMHIGHQLWNELTAYDRLSQNLLPEMLPILIVPNAERGTEAYGPFDAIFPEWIGKVDRSLRAETDTLASFTYRRKHFLLRPLDEYVSANLSDRIIRFAEVTPVNLGTRTLITKLKLEGYVFVTIGMRVENRTIINIYALIEHLINYFSCHIHKLAIVIDGHNCRLNGDVTTTFNSFAQPAHINPVLSELQLAIQIRQRFEHTDVKILSLIGGSVSDSIVAINESHLFVAFWGAGLAKYRWVCNKIGLVLSNKSTLSLRGDLHIYNDSEYSESPTSMLFFDHRLVVDRPDSDVAFPSGSPVQPSYCNFEIELLDLNSQLKLLLQLAGLAGA